MTKIYWHYGWKIVIATVIIVYFKDGEKKGAFFKGSYYL